MNFKTNAIIPAAEDGYVRAAGVPDGEAILAAAQNFTVDDVTYEPIYILMAKDCGSPSITISKTGTGISTGADAYVFSDTPTVLDVGTNVSHTFTELAFTTDEGWGGVYIIAYATSANKALATGITVNLYNYKATFEFIAASGTIFSSTTALFGYTAQACMSLKYVNIENATIYGNSISAGYFMEYNSALIEIKLPNNITTISSTNAFQDCSSLKKISLPALTTISGSNIFKNCYNLEEINCPLTKILCRGQ